MNDMEKEIIRQEEELTRLEMRFDVAELDRHGSDTRKIIEEKGETTMRQTKGNTGAPADFVNFQGARCLPLTHGVLGISIRP